MRSLVIAALLLTTSAQAQLSWVPASGSGGGHHGRGALAMQLNGADEATQIRMVMPTLVQRPLVSDSEGKVSVPSSGLDNYHLLKAVRRSPEVVETALRYRYFNGKPSGYSPQMLLDAQQAQLEIIPAPLPREHARYETGKYAEFIVRFNGEPLVNQPLSLVTGNGSRLELKTGVGGRVRVAMPDDFSDVNPGQRANRPAEFLLSVQAAREGVSHVTTLSAPYHVNPSHWRSTWGGLAAMGFGFIGGLLWLGAVRREEA